VAIDPNSLPRDSETLRKIVVDLAEQLDRSLAEQNKYQSLLRELLEAQRNRKSEQLSKEQLALFEAAWQARSAEADSEAADDDDNLDGDAGSGWQTSTRRGAGMGKPVRSEPAASDSARLRPAAICRPSALRPRTGFPAGATVRVPPGRAARWAAVAPAVGPATGRWARHLSGVRWRS